MSYHLFSKSLNQSHRGDDKITTSSISRATPSFIPHAFTLRLTSSRWADLKLMRVSGAHNQTNHFTEVCLIAGAANTPPNQESEHLDSVSSFLTKFGLSLDSSQRNLSKHHIHNKYLQLMSG